MKTLLTGFTPFPGVAVNPSQLIVEQLRAAPPVGLTLLAEVLPTAFHAAGEQIRTLIRQHQPDAVICLGVAQRREAVNLERVARNWDEAAIPDVSGVQRSGQKILPEAPDMYESTLPLEQMFARLEGQGVPVVFSDSAGTYVCNHVFYCARHEIEQLGLAVPCGFIHVPGLVGEGVWAGMALAVLTNAVRTCLEVVARGKSIQFFMNGEGPDTNTGFFDHNNSTAFYIRCHFRQIIQEYRRLFFWAP